MNVLRKNGYTYDEDGAVWLNCEKMGLEKNEVLVRQNGIPTYFAADIAYHINKLETQQILTLGYKYLGSRPSRPCCAE